MRGGKRVLVPGGSRAWSAAAVVALVALLVAAPAAVSATPGRRAPATPEGRGLGLEFARSADPGLRMEVPARSADVLPTSIDLNADMPPVGDQGAQGSCAAWSTGYYMKTWWEKQEHPGWDVGDPAYQMSPSFLYNQVNGGHDWGTSFPAVLGLLEETGDTDLAEFPYDDDDYLSQPSADQEEMAKQYRIPDTWRYFFINNPDMDPGPYDNDITELKTHLAAGEPMVLGIPVFRDFPNYIAPPAPYYLSWFDEANPPDWRSIDEGGDFVGGHGLCVVGYNDNANPGGATPEERGGLRIINSWGPGWNGGSAGYLYLSYKFVRQWVMEAWAMDDQDSTPVISSLNPPNAATDQVVTISGNNFGGDRRQARVAFPGAPGAEVVSWTNSTVRVKVPGAAESGTAYAYDWDSERSNGKPFTADPMGASWLMAEGATWPGFDEWVLVQNPNSAEARAQLRFLTPGGPIDGPLVTVPAQSRVSVHVNDYVSDSDVSTVVTSTNGVGVCAERAMYVSAADGKWGSHDCIASKGTSTVWYLAEGATWQGYDEWILVMNPNDGPVGVRVTYQTPEGAAAGPEFELAGSSRSSVHVNEQLPGTDVSATVECTTPGAGIVAERAMYVNTPEGKVDCHNSLGSSAPEHAWGLAEGCTRAGFEEWVLVQNPTTAAVDFDFYFLTTQGAYLGPTEHLGSGERMSLRVNDYLSDADVSVEVVTATEEQKVVVERAMYISAPGMVGAHNAPGSIWMSGDWVLPEGATWPGFDEYVLVMNPGESDVTVQLTFMTPSGAVQGPSAVIGSGCRSTFRVNDYVTSDVSTQVTADGYVVAERAMYMQTPDGKRGATDSLGILGSQVLDGAGAGTPGGSVRLLGPVP
ncbi:MAG: IPT/TIG domain-containing protein [Actinomycetota bacterium]